MKEHLIIVARILLDALTEIMSLLDVRTETKVKIPKKINTCQFLTLKITQNIMKTYINIPYEKEAKIKNVND